MTDKNFVDNDWKQQAEEQKKKIEEQYAAKKEQQKVPPANFYTLLSSFASQAMVALGDMQLPGAEGRSIDFDAARFAIDTLEIIKEKTKGNLSAEEGQTLNDTLQGLRLRFVEKKKGESPIKTPDGKTSPIIQTPNQAPPPKTPPGMNR